MSFPQDERLLWTRRDLKRQGIRFNQGKLAALEAEGRFPTRVVLPGGAEGWLPQQVKAWIRKTLNAAASPAELDQDGTGGDHE